jgi:hypothetical protein
VLSKTCFPSFKAISNRSQCRPERRAKIPFANQADYQLTTSQLHKAARGSQRGKYPFEQLAAGVREQERRDF